MSGSVDSPGFWAELPRPIYALAPMEDVTDAAFRYVIARRGKPAVFFGEFTSADGLSSRGLPNLHKLLFYSEIERPVVAQLFGETPKNFVTAARICRDMGFDGIDINMGCPVKKIVRSGAGAALINTPSLAAEIIHACKEGADPLPVSVKTRIGWNEIALESWLARLLEARPAAITLHLRTRREMSKVDAHWDLLPGAVKQAAGSGTLILGNGDVRDLDHADSLVAESGADGIMLGRAVYGNPWLFNRSVKAADITAEDRLEAILEHSFAFENMFYGRKNFAVIRKHLLAYTAGFDGSRDLRRKLEEVDCAADVYDAVAWFRSVFNTGSAESTDAVRR